MRTRALSLATVVLACACTSPGSPVNGGQERSRPPSAPAAAPQPARDPPAVSQDSGPAATRCSPARRRACYGPLVIVAGKGTIGRKGHNGWKSAYEGGRATEAELSRPHFAMADRAGNIFVADKDAHAIRKISPAGTITTVAGTGSAGDDGDAPGPGTSRRLSSPNGLWVRGDGTVYILDLGNAKVRKLTTTGELTTLFRVKSGLAIGRGLWVSDDEALVYLASNDKVLEWTAPDRETVAAAGFSSLGNLVVDSSGALVVTDRAGGRVYKIDDDGARTAIAGSGRASGSGESRPALETSLVGVRAIWFHRDGGYFLATHASSRVWYVDSAGVAQLFLDSDEVSEVRGLSIDSQGNLLIVDDDRGFVRMLRPRR